MSTLANFCTGQWKGAHNKHTYVCGCLQRWATQICSLSYAATWKIPKKSESINHSHLNPSLVFRCCLSCLLLFFPPLLAICIVYGAYILRTGHHYISFYFSISLDVYLLRGLPGSSAHVCIVFWALLQGLLFSAIRPTNMCIYKCLSAYILL